MTPGSQLNIKFMQNSFILYKNKVNYKKRRIKVLLKFNSNSLAQKWEKLSLKVKS